MAMKPIEILIEAKPTGGDAVHKLASTLEELAQTLDGDLKNNANAAAAALRQLGDKQSAITRFVELKQGAQDAAARLNEAQAAAQKMGQTLATTEAPTRAQTGQMKNLGEAVRAAKAEVLQQSQAVQQARGALQQYGVSTQNLSQSQQNVKAAVSAAKLEINALVSSYAQAGQQAVASGNQQKMANAGVSKSVTDIGEQLRRIQSIAMLAVGGGFLGGVAKDALATADNFNNLQARIKLVTGEGALLASSFAAVGDIALRTNSNLEQTGTLFARIAEAGKSAGLSAQEAAMQSLALTETINQATQLSGGSAESSKAAITQLIQALQSGVLRGEEFNSVMEQSPRLAKALADGLGVTTSELRKMAETGALSSETVIRSLRSQSEAIKTEFSSLPPTVGRAIENLNTSWTLFVGNLDKGAGISKTVAGAIDSLAGNLNTVVTVAGHATVIWGGYALSQKLAAASAAQSAIAIEQAALAAASQAVASGRAAVATGAHGAAAAVAAGQVTGYGAATASAGAATAATATQSAASVVSWRAVGGAVLGVVSKLALWATAIYTVGSVLKPAGKWIGEHVAMLAGYKIATEEVVLSEKELAEAAKAAADAQYMQAEAMRVARDESFGLSKAAATLTASFDKMVKDGNSAAEAIGKIGKDFDLSKLPGIRDAASVLDRLRADGKLTADEFQAAWTSALNGKDLAVFETTARAAFAGAKREAELLAAMLDAGLRESVKRAGLDFESLRGGISKVSQSAVNDTQAIIDGLDRLGVQGVDTARALTASLGKGINTADTQQALELVKQQIESVRSKLGERVTNGLLDQAKEKSLELGDVLDKNMPGINSLREAMLELGIKSRESLQQTAKKAEESFDIIIKAGQAEGESYVAWQNRKSDAAAKMLARVIEANGGVATEFDKAKAAANGLEIAVDSAGKATVRAGGDGKKSVDGMGQSFAQSTEQVKKYEEAIDKMLMKYKLSADYSENQLAILEKENALIERRIDLENKRLNRDKEGFSLDTGGKRVNIAVDTQASTYSNAKSQGLTEEQALKVAAQFINERGEKMGWQGGGFNGLNQGQTWGSELQKAIDKVKLDNAADAAQKAKTEHSAQPQQMQPQPPANAAPHQQNGNSYITNITLPGGAVKSVSTTNAESQNMVNELVRQLAFARTTASR